jgi:hypothetical protein
MECRTRQSIAAEVNKLTAAGINHRRRPRPQ